MPKASRAMPWPWRRISPLPSGRVSSCVEGMLPVPLPEEEVEALMAAGEAEIDLEDEVVRFDGREVGFEIDPDLRHRLLNGLDDIGITLQSGDAIEHYEAERERTGPVTTGL